MVVDALLEADRALKLSERIHSPAEFCALDDQILEVSSMGRGGGRGRGPRVRRALVHRPWCSAHHLPPQPPHPPSPSCLQTVEHWEAFGRVLQARRGATWGEGGVAGACAREDRRALQHDMDCWSSPRPHSHINAHPACEQVDPEEEAALRAAQAVIARVRRRDLYKYVTEAFVPQASAACGSVGGGQGRALNPPGATASVRMEPWLPSLHHPTQYLLLNQTTHTHMRAPPAGHPPRTCRTSWSGGSGGRQASRTW